MVRDHEAASSSLATPTKKGLHFAVLFCYVKTCSIWTMAVCYAINALATDARYTNIFARSLLRNVPFLQVSPLRPKKDCILQSFYFTFYTKNARRLTCVFIIIHAVRVTLSLQCSSYPTYCFSLRDHPNTRCATNRSHPLSRTC